MTHIQEIYALLRAHTAIRTLMPRAAEQVQISPTQISFTATIGIMDNNLIPLGLVREPRRLHIVESVIKEIGQQRLPKQRVRIQRTLWSNGLALATGTRNRSICRLLLWNWM